MKCVFCGKEAKVRGSMGDFCMECFEEKNVKPIIC